MKPNSWGIFCFSIYMKHFYPILTKICILKIDPILRKLTARSSKLISPKRWHYQRLPIFKVCFDKLTVGVMKNIKKETFVQCNQTCENRYSCEWNSNKFKLHKINKIKWQNIIFLPKAIRYICKLLLKCSNFKNIFG